MKHGHSVKGVKEACMIVSYAPIGIAQYFTNDKN